MTPTEKLEELGLKLPAPLQLPSGATLPFVMARIVGNQVHLSGHVPQNPDGTIWQTRGRVGAELTIEQGQEAARLCGLALMGSIERELGSLDRIEGWVSALGFVNAAEGFHDHPQVMNGFSRLLVDIFGEQRGAHTRSAIGAGGLPFNVPVEIEAVALIAPA